MNPLNDEDRDTSNCVHKFVTRMVADNMQCDFIAGSYSCAGDGKSVKLNGFLKGKILESNLLIAVSNQTLTPNPRLLTQEVSYFYNKQNIGTRMIQSLVFPP